MTKASNVVLILHCLHNQRRRQHHYIFKCPLAGKADKGNSGYCTCTHNHFEIIVPTLPDTKKEYAVLSSSTYAVTVSKYPRRSEWEYRFIPPTCSLPVYANTRIANYCTRKIPACAYTTFSTRIANYRTLAVQHVTTPLPQQLFLTFIPVVPQACDNAT